MALSIIDSRLAASQHLRTIENLISVERVVKGVEKIFDDAFRAVSLMVVSGEVKDMRQAARLTFQNAFTTSRRTIFDDFRKLAKLFYDNAVDSLVGAIPRNYFRLASPTLFMFESFDATENDKLAFLRQLIAADNADGIAINVDNTAEPIARSKVKNLSDDEWRSVLDRIIFKPPTEERAEDILNQADEAGRDLRNRLELLSRKISDVDGLVNRMTRDIANGDNLQQMERKARPFVNGIKSSAKRIVRTEGMRLAERMQRETWGSLGEMMIGVQILAILDQNTRPAHATRNGTIYYRRPERGQLSMFTDLPLLPDEPNCRCWSTPVLRPPKELGNDPVLQAKFVNNTGSNIPDPTTYDQWFANVDSGRQKLAVGSRRFAEVEKLLDGSRNPEWTDFISGEDGGLLSTQQIANESPLQRILRKKQVADLLDKRRERIGDIATVGFIL